MSDVHKHGILEVNSEGLVTALVEKPKADQTTSRKAVSEHSIDKWVPLAAMVTPDNCVLCICVFITVSSVLPAHKAITANTE